MPDDKDRRVDETISEAARLAAKAKLTVDALVKLLTAHAAGGTDA